MSRAVNLIPMAGAGQRFLDAGFKIPKPLIKIDQDPMILHAARSLPKCDRWIFACREEHIQVSKIDLSLQQHFPNCKIISVKSLTEGQASTCLLARDLIAPEDQLTIGACDNAMTYSLENFRSEVSDSGVDVLIWTFRENPAVLQNPKMYGWVKVDNNNFVEKVSVKVPISTTPMKDHAVIGAFTFKRSDNFFKCTDLMIESNRRVNGEFYVDEVMNLAIEAGLKVKVFEVDRYICWGTPNDLKVYQYWRTYFESVLSLK